MRRSPRLCGADVNPLPLEIGQSQGGQHLARSDAAAVASTRKPHRQHVFAAASVHATSGRKSIGSAPRWDERSIGHDSAASNCSIRSPRPARKLTKESGLRRKRCDAGLSAALGQNFHRCGTRVPGGACAVRRRSNVLGGIQRFRPTPIPSLRRVPRFRPPAPGETSSVVSDGSPGSSPTPGRRGETAAPGTASSRGARSTAGLPAWKIECALVCRTISSHFLRYCRSRRSTLRTSRYPPYHVVAENPCDVLLDATRRRRKLFLVARRTLSRRRTHFLSPAASSSRSDG